jgi:hypothetical protein
MAALLTVLYIPMIERVMAPAFVCIIGGVDMEILVIALGVFAGVLLFKARWVILIAIGVLVYLLPAHAETDNELTTPLTTEQKQVFSDIILASRSATDCKIFDTDQLHLGALLLDIGLQRNDLFDEGKFALRFKYLLALTLPRIDDLFNKDADGFCKAAWLTYGPKGKRLLKKSD